jgi:putative DNA primase/helicase
MKFEFNSSDFLQAFRGDVSRFGLIPTDSIEPGRLFRCRAEGKKTGYPGWGIIHLNPDGTAGGTIGIWGGNKQNFFYRNDGNRIGYNDLTPEARVAFQKQMDEARARLKTEIAAKQKKAAGTARRIWEKSRQPDQEHLYLKAKGINAHGIRQVGKVLIIPLYSTNGELVSLQRIFPDGGKKYHPGGQVKGCSFLIGDPAKSYIIYICEGFATGASIHEATGQPVAVAFTANNLDAVTEIMKKRHPDKRVIIAADNDLETAEKRPDIGNPGRKAAEAAAAKHGVGLCVCPINSDFNDLHQARGIDAVRESLRKTLKIAFEPLPLERDIEKPEPYPLDALGDTLSMAAKALFDNVQAPDGICAHAVLGFATHAVQGHAIVVVDGRAYPLNNNFLSIASRSARKSEVDRQAGMVHSEIQKKMLEIYAQVRAAYEDDKEVYKKARDAVMNDKKTILTEKNDALSELRKTMPKPPYVPLMVFSDPTVQGIHKMFEAGTPSKYLCADEGGQISGGHSMRAEEKTYTATIYSKYWDGAAIPRVRGGDGVSVLYGVRLSMHLMMQDKVAAAFFNDDVMRDQGLISRFLVTYPSSLTGTRGYKATNVSESPGMRVFHDRIREILSEPLPMRIDDQTGEPLNELEPRTLYLDEDAKRLWVESYEDIEAASGKGRPFESIEGFAGKSSNHMIRLAGVMAMFDDIHRKTIPRKYMENAITLIEYYLNERMRVSGIAAPNLEIENAKTLLTWINERGLKVVTLPDVYQFGPSRFRHKAQAEAVTRTLENHRWLILEPAIISELSNKKSNKAWRVNHAEI